MRAGNCFSLNTFLQPYLGKVNRPIRILVDLRFCVYMDSTFIGFLMSMVNKCGIYSPECVNIANPSDRCTDALKKLSCIDRFHIIREANTPYIPLFTLQAKPPEFNR